METASPSLNPPIQSPNHKITQSRNLVLLFLFFLSGAAALIYEIVWLQLLQFVIGSSTISVGVLLGTFMGGMGLGSLLAPRVISARQHPLRVYAWLEAAIGAAGLALLFVIPLVGRVYAAAGGSGVGGFLLRGAVAAVCLLLPTMAMGATLPVIARWVETTPSGVSWLGRFYAGNIAGAVAGCLLAGFVLLRVFDMAITTYVAVAINIAIAGIAFALARATPPQASDEGAPETIGGFGLVHVAIALSGFCALAGEVVWTRLLGLLFGATVYTFAIVLAVFLIGLGLGSAAASLWTRTPSRARRALAWCQWGSVAAIAWTAHALMTSLPYWPGASSISTSIWTIFRVDFLRAIWAVLPAPVLWGASVPLAIAAAAQDDDPAAPAAGRDHDPAQVVGGVYAANTIGAIAGALMTSLLLVASIGSQHTQQAMMAVAACAALLASVDRILPIVALAATVLLTTAVPPLPGVLVVYGRNAAAWAGHAGEIFYVGEGMNSSVAVSRSADGVLNYHNAGKIQASSQPQDMRLQRMLGHLTTLVPANPKSVLVIGCGAGVTAGAVSVNPRVQRVTIAEIEPLVPKAAAAHFSGPNADVIRNPKTQVRIDDARHFLLTTSERFDAITSDPLDPWVKGAAMLYTQEFFELARRRLNPGGVMTLFVQLYESSPETVKSEVATFFDVFPNGVVWGNTFDGQADDLVLMGSVESLSLDLDWMEWGWRQPEYAAVRRSLGEINILSVIDLLGNYGGRASDLSPWLTGAAITRDRDLRLQYLAGLGLNLHVGRSIYAEMLRYRRFPADLFTGSEQRLWDLRQAIAGPKE